MYIDECMVHTHLSCPVGRLSFYGHATPQGGKCHRLHVAVHIHRHDNHIDWDGVSVVGYQCRANNCSSGYNMASFNLTVQIICGERLQIIFVK